mgnify:CR=1 FL=1
MQILATQLSVGALAGDVILAYNMSTKHTKNIHKLPTRQFERFVFLLVKQ